MFASYVHASGANTTGGDQPVLIKPIEAVYPTLLCAIYGDSYSYGAHGAIQINQSIRKDQGQARTAGGELVDDN